MIKKLIVLSVVLPLYIFAFLHPCCRVSVNGEAVSGCYTPEAAAAALDASRAAAEELCRGETRLPTAVIRRGYALKPCENRVQALTDAVLRQTKGVTAVKAVYVHGKRLGAVREDCNLRELLRRNIVEQQPNAAVFGKYSGDVILCTQYSRADRLTDPGDMVLLVSGMAPVMYYDRYGQRA